MTGPGWATHPPTPRPIPGHVWGRNVPASGHHEPFTSSPAQGLWVCAVTQTPGPLGSHLLFVPVTGTGSSLGRVPRGGAGEEPKQTPPLTESLSGPQAWEPPVGRTLYVLCPRRREAWKVTWKRRGVMVIRRPTTPTQPRDRIRREALSTGPGVPSGCGKQPPLLLFLFFEQILALIFRCRSTRTFSCRARRIS